MDRIVAEGKAMPLYVQYGCSTCAPEGWVNFDASPTLRMQRIPLFGRIAPGPRFPANARLGNIVSGLPIADGTADAAYCSHVLEHLALNELEIALANTYRILRHGGIFRMVLPDLRKLAEDYVKDTNANAAKQFVRNTNFGRETRSKKFGSLIRDWLGNSAHLWMWDFQSLSAELAKVGFVNIRRATLGDNPDPMFAKLETSDRWNDQLGIQCEKQ